MKCITFLAVNESAGLNRVARLAGRITPRAVKTIDRPPEEWIHIAVPAIVSEDTFARAGQRLADNKRFASRKRQRVLRLLVKDVLVGPERITIRHRIPVRERTTTNGHEHPNPDTEGDHCVSSPLRWGRVGAPPGSHVDGDVYQCIWCDSG